MWEILIHLLKREFSSSIVLYEFLILNWDTKRQLNRLFEFSQVDDSSTRVMVRLGLVIVKDLLRQWVYNSLKYAKY